MALRNRFQDTAFPALLHNMQFWQGLISVDWLSHSVVQLLICVQLFCDPMDCSLMGSSVMGFPQQVYFPGGDCHFLLQGIFLIQGSSLRLLHCRQSPAMQMDSLPTDSPRIGDPFIDIRHYLFSNNIGHFFSFYLRYVLYLSKTWTSSLNVEQFPAIFP